MTDTRFFKQPAPLSLAQIAGITGAELRDPSHGAFAVAGVGTLDDAGEDELSFLDNPKYRDALSRTKAGACMVHPDAVRFVPENVRVLISKSPYKAYALAAQALYPVPKPPAGIAATARVHASAKIGKDCVIEDYAVIAEGVEIGEGSWVEPHAVISGGCVIGRGCRIGAHASVAYAMIGDNVRLYPGVRIGQDGFGFAIDPAGYVKVPQLGRVIIEGHTEVGANATVDRGTLGDTVIGMGSWIDNLVQIAHNVKIGKACIIAAQTGISGSTQIGNYVAIGGQAGFAGHLKVGDMARIAAKSGVTRDVPAKEEWMGYPAMPMKQYLRQVATLNQIITKKPKGSQDD
jgi:UDP-3-O-[3-hydroxymyristoyl] glucosamine N-acyltransferase